MFSKCFMQVIFNNITEFRRLVGKTGHKYIDVFVFFTIPAEPHEPEFSNFAAVETL